MFDASEIEDFFKWVNTKKKIKPCYASLDMRGKVSSPCSRYVINDRVHYLDDASFRIFSQGMKRNRGVFTVDVYKAVVLQDRRYFDKKEARALTSRPSVSLPSTAAATSAAPEPKKEAESSKNIGPVKFGYFHQTEEKPHDVVFSVYLTVGSNISAGKITKFSEFNLVVIVETIDEPGVHDKVIVQFTGIRQIDSGAVISDIEYSVDAVQSTVDGIELKLAIVSQQETVADTIAKIEAYFDPSQIKEKDDEFESLLSWCFERTYANGITRIPFYMAADEHGNPAVKSFAITDENKYLTSFFYNKSDRYNMSPICLPERLIALRKCQSLLVVMYRAQGENDRNRRIHSAAENDYSSREEFLNCVRHAFSYPEHCLIRLSYEHMPAASIIEDKRDILIKGLDDLSPDNAKAVLRDIESLHAVGFVADMSKYAQRWIDEGKVEDDTQGNSLCVWVGSELRNAKTGEVIRRVDLSPGVLDPTLIRFGIVERRREPRYLARTAITVTEKGKQFSGFSSNISWHGLCVKTDELLDIKPGSIVKISFPSMQKKEKTLQLVDIPYRLVHAINTDHSTLMLERVTGSHKDPLDTFFDNVIRNNRHKLKVDTNDVINSISSRIYESIAAINSDAIAFFVGHHEARGASLLATGIPVTGNRLAAYCALSNTPNPATLLSTESVGILFDAIHLHGRRQTDENELDSPFGFDLAVFNKIDSEGLEVEVADEYSSEGFQNIHSMSEWTADKKNCRILHLAATSSSQLKDDYFDSMLENLKTLSISDSEQLIEFIQMLVGCGEIIDVTDQYSYFWP